MEIQPGRGQRGPSVLAWGGGVWSLPSLFQVSQLQLYPLASREGGPSSFHLRLSSPKLGERPWVTFCPQTTAPPPPRARCFLSATRVPAACPHRPEPPSSASLPAGLLQRLCMGGAGDSSVCISLSPPPKWGKGWWRVGGVSSVTKNLLCARNPSSSLAGGRVLLIKGTVTVKG